VNRCARSAFAQLSAILRERFDGAPQLDERMHCYILHIGLHELRCQARMHNRARYERPRDVLVALPPAVLGRT
jgi:hypothetical protein